MTREWYEDAQFWIDFYDFMFPASAFEKAEEQVAHLLELAGVAGAGVEVLDLCCGPGRHCVPLAKRGCAVTGVDRTEFLLRKAGERCAENGVRVTLVEADMRDYAAPDRYDLILNMFTSFGYFADPADDLRVIGNVHRSLKTGGKVVLETMGKEILARIFSGTISSRTETGRLIVQRHAIVNGWSRVENEWIILDNNGGHRTWTFGHRLYSAVELAGAFERGGFGRTAVYGDLEGSAYDQDAKRLVLVAQK